MLPGRVRERDGQIAQAMQVRAEFLGQADDEIEPPVALEHLARLAPPTATATTSCTSATLRP